MTANREIARKSREMVRLLNVAAKDVAATAARFKLRHPNYVGNFFTYNKTLEKQIDRILAVLNDDMLILLDDGAVNGWDIANKQNDVLVASYTRGIPVPAGVMSSMHQVNVAALDAFLDRSINGLTLSDRVWALTQNMKGNLETLLGSGIAQGKSAARLSRDVRSSLKNPNNLFRRKRVTIIDPKTGEPVERMVLSKSARAYHPGQGVYRSSYKNALRLTQETINQSYRSSDFTRRQQLPFVRGVRVHLSASHPEFDICDSLQGLYPKGFFWTGWHIKCICFTTSELIPRSEFKEYLRTGEILNQHIVKTIPVRANAYVKKHKTTINKWKSKPDWVRNFTKSMTLKKKVTG